MIKADQYFVNTLKEIVNYGTTSVNPRTKWSDGSVAHYKSIKQVTNTYDILKGEYPIITLRSTPLRSSFYDIESIYIKQTNIIEEMNPTIRFWWTDFIVGKTEDGRNHIGQTYGHTVKRFKLIDRLLAQLETNHESRRHVMSLWQDIQMIEDPKALVPCAMMTEWSVTQDNGFRLVDLTLIQRSQDIVITASINPAQYVMLGMIICNHLTFKTGIVHTLNKFVHTAQDVHIYDRNMWAVEELLRRTPSNVNPSIKLVCEPKNFYDHKESDFEFSDTISMGLPKRLEIAI